MSWREERRRDEAARREQDRADRAVAAEIRREDRQQKADLQKEERKDRRRWLAAVRRGLAKWMGHEAMALVVMGAPMLLAWTAMAFYGHDLYGGVGWLLPLFTEGAMLWFALEIPRARRARKPAGWLRVGLVVFGAVSAGLQYVHGVAGDGGSWDRGVVMAVVAVGGVVVHQLITAGPRRRRTRAERASAAVARRARRRAMAIQRAAVSQAVAELAADGTVRLVYRPGLFTVQRRGLFRRGQLVEAVPLETMAAVPAPGSREGSGVVPDLGVPAVPDVVPETGADNDRLGDGLGDAMEEWLRAQTAPGGSHLTRPAQTPGTVDARGTGTTDAAACSKPDGNQRASAAGTRPGTAGEPGPGPTPATRQGRAATRSVAEMTEEVRTAISRGDLPENPTKQTVQRFLRCRASAAAEVARAVKTDPEGGAVPAEV